MESFNFNIKKYRNYFFIVLFLCFISLTQSELIIGNNNSKKLFIIIFGLLTIFLFACYRFYEKKEERIEKVYLKTALPLMLIFSLLLPPGFIPDEWAHFRAIASLSDQIMGDRNENVSLNYNEYRWIKDNSSNMNLSNYRGYTYEKMAESRNTDIVVTEWEKEDFKKVFSYFPGIVGYLFTYSFNMNLIISLYTIRLFCMLFYLILTYYALKIIPFNSFMLFTLLYVPVVVQQGMSMSYDSTLNAVSFLTISMGLALVFDPKFRWTIQNKIIYLLLALVLFTAKNGIYSFLLLLPFILTKDELTWSVIKKKIPYLIVYAAILLALNSSYVLMSALNQKQSKNAAFSIYPELPYNSSFSNYKYSLSYFIKNPFKFFYVLSRDLFVHFGYYYRTFFSSLSWLTINLSNALNYLWFLLLLIAAFLKKKNEIVCKFVMSNKIICFCFFAMISFLIRLSMLISWTPLGFNKIVGVQGRYYFPIIMLLILCFKTKKEIKYQYFLNQIFIYIVLMLSFIETLDLFRISF